MIVILSQLATLFWKQRVCFRTDLPSLVAVLILPSILLFLSSTNSGTDVSSVESLDLVECKIDNLLYCNYPMRINVNADFSEDSYFNDVDSPSPEDVLSTLDKAASKVAENLGSDFESFFLFDGEEPNDPTTKVGAEVNISSPNAATAVWYLGENSAFAQKLVTLFNQELQAVGNDIIFEEIENPYQY